VNDPRKSFYNRECQEKYSTIELKPYNRSLGIQPRLFRQAEGGARFSIPKRPLSDLGDQREADAGAV
jgi:hypothetical protein